MKVILSNFGNASHCRNAKHKIRSNEEEEKHWTHVQKWSDGKTGHTNKWHIAEFFLKDKRQAGHECDWLIDSCIQNKLSHIATITCLEIRERKKRQASICDKRKGESFNTLQEHIGLQEYKCSQKGTPEISWTFSIEKGNDQQPHKNSVS